MLPLEIDSLNNKNCLHKEEHIFMGILQADYSKIVKAPN
jgi:hypothetical protein